MESILTLRQSLLVYTLLRPLLSPPVACVAGGIVSAHEIKF